ncbi:MAG TPA: TonB-dependent receptor plug domain-containing protein, partial [Ignavibacteriaceae bacterium]
MFKQLTAVLFLSSFSVLPQINDSIPSNIVDKTDSLVVSSPDSLHFADTTSTTITPVKPDTLAPIQGEPLTNVSTIIDHRTILFNDYRYAGDLLRSFPLNFIRDQGFVGQPNETFIYGVGNSGISYLQDGVLVNNRFTNSLNLNHIQSEDIDSIEIIPSPRGFLYGPYNNPVTVNFITRDFVSPQPYTRIKYYEGYFGEAMIDGKFNARIFKRWNFGFQLTNRKFDSTYTNSEFSIWQINTKLKYFLSNSVNISAYYGYVDSRVGLNGGVDVDSISRITDDINSILYEPLRAPVLHPFQKLETLQHNFVLRTLAKLFDNSKLDLSFYYKYGFDEYLNVPAISLRNIENKTMGGSILYNQEPSDFFGLQIG